MADRIFKPKAVVLDIDDVIDDFCGYLCWIHNRVNGTHVTANDIRDWNFETLKVKDRNGNEVIGTDLRQTFRYWEEHGLYGSVDLLPRAYDAIRKIVDYQYKVILLTARDKKYEDETKLHLWKNGIIFDEIYFKGEDDGSDFKTKKIKKLSRRYNIQLFADDKYSTVEHVAENTNVNCVCLIETASTRDLKKIEGDTENRLQKNDDIHKFVTLYDAIILLKDLRPKPFSE